MSQIDELLKMEQYNIYLYKSLDRDKLDELAECFSKENVDLLKYFSLNKFISKFCWVNIVFIINKMKYPQKLRGLSCLFELLKDVNWPVFQEVVDVLISFNKKDIVPTMEKYLCQAYSEGDGMWISGICLIAQEKNIQPSDFQNKKIYDLFQYGDF